MAKIPRRNEVLRAIRAVAREVKMATKEVNQQAAKRLARGDYVAAQSLIDTAKTVATFSAEVAELQRKWRDVGAGVSKDGGKSQQTPMWEFYRPILRALVALNGDANLKLIIGQLEEGVSDWLKEGDFTPNTRGIPRWQVMVRRARKVMTKEGFLSGEHKQRWIITKKGEQAAAKEK
ncbi:MAG: hypothetical protein WD768_12715 [Phycisphaeraceae bacterium]